MLLCVHNDVHALWKSYFVNAHMIGEWPESLLIQPISKCVTRCLWMVGNVVVVCVNDKTLVHIPQFVTLSNV